MVLNIIIIRNLFQDQAQNILKHVLFFWRHITPNPFVIFIQDPLKARINFPALVHREGHWVHLEVHRELICLLILLLRVLELNKVIALVLDERDCALGKSLL